MLSSLGLLSFPVSLNKALASLKPCELSLICFGTHCCHRLRFGLDLLHLYIIAPLQKVEVQPEVLTHTPDCIVQHDVMMSHTHNAGLHAWPPVDACATWSAASAPVSANNTVQTTTAHPLPYLHCCCCKASIETRCGHRHTSGSWASLSVIQQYQDYRLREPLRFTNILPRSLCPL